MPIPSSSITPSLSDALNRQQARLNIGFVSVVYYSLVEFSTYKLVHSLTITL